MILWHLENMLTLAGVYACTVMSAI